MPGQGEKERRPLPGFGLNPDAAAVAMNDPLDHGQADAVPRVIEAGMKALERNEQFVPQGHIEADAVVPDKIDGPPAIGRRAEFDFGPETLGREFHGVGKEMLKRDSHKMTVAMRLDMGAYHKIRQPSGLRFLQIEQNGFGHGAKVEDFHFYCRSADPGQFQEFIDEAGHALRRTMEKEELLPTPERQRGRRFVAERLAMRVDRPDGGPQVMGDRIIDGFDFLAESVDLRPPLGKLILKVIPGR
jgi:hypothetical protein